MNKYEKVFFMNKKFKKLLLKEYKIEFKKWKNTIKMSQWFWFTKGTAISK